MGERREISLQTFENKKYQTLSLNFSINFAKMEMKVGEVCSPSMCVKIHSSNKQVFSN